MRRDRNVAMYIIICLIASVPAILAVLTTEQTVLHATINRVHAPWADLLLKYATHLADGLVPTAIAVLLLWIGTWRSFLMMAVSTGTSAILVQVLKRQVFASHDRPLGRFHDLPELHFVPGVELHHHFSFPSGHSTAAFSMCLALAVIDGQRWTGAAWALLASILGFSRVYLSQHFTEDVLAGALLGVCTAGCVYHALYRGGMSLRPWLDHRPFRKGGTVYHGSATPWSS